ncbi:MAG: hypothetical protein ACE5PM_04395 [Candidatus Hydrothermarchaeales archaeon]
MVYYGLDENFAGQIAGHYGLLEIYAHIYASLFLFLMSLVSISLLYYYYRSSIFRMQGVLNGIFYTGLIGVGEAFEHLFASITIGSIFHYLHLISAPIALIFYYLGIVEIFERDIKEGEEGRYVDFKISLSVFLVIGIAIMILSRFSRAIWDFRVEEPFIMVTVIPTLVIVWILLKKSEVITESTILLASLRIVSVGVCILTLTILIGRQADIYRWANVYIIAHQLQNIFHIIIGTALLMVVMTLSQVERVLKSIKSQR